MSVIATPTPAPQRRHSLDHRGAPPPDSSPPRAPASSRHSRGGAVLFEVPFTSAMSDSDLAVLRRVLDLSTHMYPKMRPDPNSPGFAPLDHFSSLYLEHGAGKGQWVLEARTWGNPAPHSVHEWEVLVAQAARQLDPHVTLPKRLPDSQLATPGRPLGRAANGRLASFRRRLVGLP